MGNAIQSLLSSINDALEAIILTMHNKDFLFAASAVQFYVTDETSHFLRGSLYFNSPPNADSLAPVITFVKDDMMHLLNTFQWHNP